jgi:hypothetical protein
MVLYKKVFPLGKDVSFFDYITALRKKYFPNYVLTIDQIPSTENYQAQVFFTAPLWRWGLANVFPDGVLLNKCTIQHFKDEEHFSLQASPKTSNLFYAAFYVMTSVMTLIFALFVMIEKDAFSFNNSFALAIITILFLAPPVSIYLRDKKLLDKVGSLGTELERN